MLDEFDSASRLAELSDFFCNFQKPAIYLKQVW